MTPKAFFAYPNEPRISETITTFLSKMNASGLIQGETWEGMQIGGKLLVTEICAKIDECDLFCADITRLNPNVLFEIGFAIAKRKRIWLIRDTSFPADNSDFKQFKVLTTIGYRDYVNSKDISEAYYKDLPHETLEATIYDSAIVPAIRADNEQHILYLKAYYEDETSIKVSQYLDEEASQRKLSLLVDDPAEAAIQPLSWYAANVHAAQEVLCHLTALDRNNSKIQNAKHSLIAGMAHGFDIPVLLLIEGNLFGPADYKDLLYNYVKVKDALSKVRQFIAPALRERKESREESLREKIKARNVSELAMLKIGEPIAEHEEENLSDHAFIETSAYREAIDGTQTIFVGRKGVGKTANFRRISKVLGRDKRVVVCEIKPLSYELTSLLDVAKRLSVLSKRGFLFESLWKFLVYSELAKQAVQEIYARPSGEIFSAERSLVKLVEDRASLLKLDFSARLDKLSGELLNSEVSDNDTQEASIAVSEVLHAGIIKNLVDALLSALSDKIRIVVLVDNLDKAWDRGEDTRLLSYFFLGLLSALRRISNDFKNRPTGKFTLQASLCVFVRADIFDMVLEVAREPDKLQHHRISWDDKARLRLLADHRLAAAVGVNEMYQVVALWKKFFVTSVRGVELFDHIFSVVLPRPRDLLVYLRAAITSAVDRRRDRVQEDDFDVAEEAYSNFAYSSLVVELRERVVAVEDVLSAFMGMSSVLTESELVELIVKEGAYSEADTEGVIESLAVSSFLEINVPSKGFLAAKEPKEYKRLHRASSNISAQKAEIIRFRIHRAFWNALLIG